MSTAQRPGTGLACAPLLDRFADAFAVAQRGLLAQWRTALALWSTTADRDREFVSGQLALLMNVHPQTAQALLADVLAVAPIPGLLDAWEAGGLTDRHVRGALAELDRCVADDSLRGRVMERVLRRCRDRAEQGADWPTPGGLRRMIRAAALLMDPKGAQERQDAKADDRGTQTYPLPDGQAALSLEGPAEQVLIAARGLRARAKLLARRPGETRTVAQLEFDLAVALLSGQGQETADAHDLPHDVDPEDVHVNPSTGEVVPAPHPQRPGSAVTIEVQVLIPFDTLTSTSVSTSVSTSTRARAEAGGSGTGSGWLGELVGHGPITPATCQDLLSRATTIRRVITDPSTGRVMAVDDPIPGPAHPSVNTVAHVDLGQVLQHLQTAPVTLRDLSTHAYRPTRRAVTFVQTRDQTCRFPAVHPPRHPGRPRPPTTVAARTDRPRQPAPALSPSPPCQAIRAVHRQDRPRRQHRLDPAQRHHPAHPTPRSHPPPLRHR